MTITNRDLFYTDPTQSKIPNDGYAQVIKPTTDEQWQTLRWELTHFVCEGEYRRGLERIIDSFLTNLHQSQQPAVWVSGFYGSGKTQLVRVLEYLWRDTAIPGGGAARELVTLPDDVGDYLSELSSAGKRFGGLWSAAGTLASGSGDAVRIAFLSVLFSSAGLPEDYRLARFVIWARENGYLDAVSAAVVAEGRTFDKEVHDLYVSPIIAKALLDADPSLGSSVQDVRELLKTQFPQTTTDIGRAEMLDVMERVLSLQSNAEGKMPLTLIVLDEMQQYIGEDPDKALDVAYIAEDCSSRFKNQVLIVATGQSGLTSTATLQRLTDRFTLQVALSDKDVETVVRQVVLRKRPDHIAALKLALDDVSGEIDRELGGTQLAPKAADKSSLIPDYPLLPTRRRFWEMALRAIDRTGKAGVIRTQLGLVHQAAASVAGAPIGHVVGADFLYTAQSIPMQHTGVLLKEIDERIRGLRSEGPDGELKSRICALIFLISQIPSRTMSGETGLLATAPFLADLLVEDLAHDGARLRKRVPELLDDLVVAGDVQRVGDEYVLQTEEGAEWDKEYQSSAARLRDDTVLMNQLRTERLTTAVEGALSGLKLTQGTSKTPRNIRLYWSQDEPSVDEGDIPVWIRDEWSVSESQAKTSAAESGDQSPTIFVFIPQHDAAQIKTRLASHAAAKQTLQRPTPQTDEGKVAQRAMGTTRDTEDTELATLFETVVSRARVLQGGGGDVTSSNLKDAVDTAAKRSLVRLFPKFGPGDNANWGKVVTQARDGAPDALVAVGHQGEVLANDVCKAVLAAITPAGTKGADLRKRFGGPPFGWPRDAVDGAILVLLAAGNVTAREGVKELGGPKDLPPTQIGKVTLYQEDPPPTPTQRAAVSGLMGDAGVPYNPGQVGPQIPVLLQRLKTLAARCGGAPPLPAPPNTDHIDDLAALSGNRRFSAVGDDYARLRADLDRWLETDKRREQREAEWQDLRRLLRHADGIPIAAAVGPPSAAILAERQLLDDPDPVLPLLQQLTDSLRTEVKRRAILLAAAQRTAIGELEAWDEWEQLEKGDRDAIVIDAKLVPAHEPDVSTGAKLLESLDATSLAAWQDRISLVPGRRDQARHRAAKQLEPESVAVQLSSATIKGSDDLKAYVDDLRARVQPHLDAHKTVIL